ncbi:hypothetical protein [uncultured Pseudacidovorax sp.]|uniref:hypothetical protein n=1 Tax=uncultured Pseudacidovorax sp. TaxID=679313 RepID=UPI0025D1B2F6|nr:hypothetical protein [uncultured Pseudacidovorax sp.]
MLEDPTVEVAQTIVARRAERIPAGLWLDRGDERREEHGISGSGEPHALDVLANRGVPMA